MVDGSGDDAIALTKLKYKGEEVIISIYAPKKYFPDSDQYACSFSVIGGDIQYFGKSIGFDSMQSLILSLTKIGTFLETNDDLDRSLIEWEGGPMGFPTFPNI